MLEMAREVPETMPVNAQQLMALMQQDQDHALNLKPEIEVFALEEELERAGARMMHVRESILHVTWKRRTPTGRKRIK